MHRFINLYYYNEKPLPATLKVSPSVPTVDTKICLLSSQHDVATPCLVPGLVNTGNSCFLNSVLQSLSSLPKLQAYLHDMDTNSSNTTAELPVTRSLLKTLRLLSVPSTRQTAFKPVDIVSAMSSNRRVVNREQQDAQELFQFLSGELENESVLAKKRQGFRDLLSFSTKTLLLASAKKEKIDNPFTGLLANRLSCMQCGYTEAIRHFSFNNVQLTLPNTDTTTLDDCLNQLTTMEYLNDVNCRKCSFLDTVEKLTTEIESLRRSDKVEKLACLEKIKLDIEHRLSKGRIHEETQDEQLNGFLSKMGRVSSKQAMFAKPPKVLCLHVARSTYSPTGDISKNPCHIQFPQVLDLAPYCTNGTLNTTPDLPISSNTTTSSVKYRLMSSIVHYGSHNFGHFIAYKRRLVAEKCSCHACCDDETVLTHHDSSWFKISDERVDACSVDEVLEANPYMLLYELIEDDITSVVPQPVTQSLSSFTIAGTTSATSAAAVVAVTTASTATTTTRHDDWMPAPKKRLPLTHCSQPRRRNSNAWNQTPVAIF
ncbi:uncharacterized protein EV154DRAFT_414363 [Mucor mucedo]|uniref:uncharacterized protein n=1 Tax=Mucor mucedo TaxID=29922 RepID=UPI00221FB6D3|nr:uncharacterized protein EV154DRAFT_414363 [Mucor mucedo]KAI7894875.1 hypothetical protein EV154DRAFT_414363 [Mucor mucedo]